MNEQETTKRIHVLNESLNALTEAHKSLNKNGMMLATFEQSSEMPRSKDPSECVESAMASVASAIELLCLLSYREAD